MTRNDITNDIIASGPDGTEAQDKYAKGWEAIFGKKKEFGFSKGQQEILDEDEPILIYGGMLGGGKCISQAADMARVQEWLERTGPEFAEQVKRGSAGFIQIPVKGYSGTERQQGCHAGRDGECSWGFCPQIKDNEPTETGRSCPHWNDEDED